MVRHRTMTGLRTEPTLVTTSAAAMARSLTTTVARSRAILAPDRCDGRFIAAAAECTSDVPSIDADAHARVAMATEPIAQSSPNPNANVLMCPLIGRAPDQSLAAPINKSSAPGAAEVHGLRVPVAPTAELGCSVNVDLPWTRVKQASASATAPAGTYRAPTTHS